MARKDPVSHLHRFEIAPERLLDEVRALGPAAVPALRALLDAPGALLPGSAARQAAAHAGPLYGELGGEAAIPRLLEVLVTAPLHSDLESGAVVGLVATEAPRAVIDAILALPDPPADREPQLLVVLASVGLRDPAVTQRVRAWLRHAPSEGARLAGRYGDPALLEDVRTAFDALPLGNQLDQEQAVTARNLAEALLALGGNDETDAPRLRRLRMALELATDHYRSEISALRSR